MIQKKGKRCSGNQEQAPRGQKLEEENRSGHKKEAEREKKLIRRSQCLEALVFRVGEEKAKLSFGRRQENQPSGGKS